MPQQLGGTTNIVNFEADFVIDTIDRLAVPRSGTNLSLHWFSARESYGSDVALDALTLDFLKPISWGKNTLLPWWSLGSTTKGTSADLQPFSLGGLFDLSGYAPEELDGKHVSIGRLLYYRQLGDQALPFFDTPIYVGGSVEVGNVWGDTSEVSLSNSLTAGSVFIVFDSIFGPLYLAYGTAEGGRKSAYLFLGQTF